jgi:hypothetical protein
LDGNASLLAIKLLGTPAVVGGATLAGRRWGPTFAGWLGGLPLASGPLTYFLAIEQGPRFASISASATIAGLLGVSAFAIVFCRLAPRGSWWLPVLVGLGAYLLVALADLFIPLSAPIAFLLALVALTFTIRWIGTPGALVFMGRVPSWDIPARVVLATALVVGLSALAGVLGPRVVGLIAPFPVYASVMAGFTHALYGPAASVRLIRGVVIGLYGFACFYLAVALLATSGVVLAFAVATVSALAVNGASMWLIRRLGW